MADFDTVGGSLQRQGFSYSPRSNVLRTPFETGAPRQAQKFDSTLMTVPVTYWFTAAEYAAFESFFRNDISFGTDSFTWFDPAQQVTRVVTIVNGEYRAQPINSHAANWEVSWVLEYYE